MALHYPTDKYVFAVVKTLDKNAIPKDKGLLKEAQSRISDFVASSSLDATLKIVLDLEQELGQEIRWISSDLTYDELIQRQKRLPNWMTRICTVELKLKPIFEYCYFELSSIANMVLMYIGFRADESQRKVNLLDNCDKAYRFKYPYQCSLKTKKQSWKTVEWRIPYFPLIENNVNHQQIIKFWEQKGWDFPLVSNCDFCFFHRYQEQRTQLEKYPERFQWWIDQEETIGGTFKKEFSYKQIQSPEFSISQTPLFNNILCNCTD